MLQRIALAVSAAVALAVAGAAVAANGAAPNKSSSSISSPIVMSSSVTALAATGPRYGDTITFDVSTTATSYPFVNLTCHQNGSLVAQGSAAFFGSASGTFGLYSGLWTGGAADCTAYLDMYSNGRWKHLASTSFHVDA